MVFSGVPCLSASRYILEIFAMKSGGYKLQFYFSGLWTKVYDNFTGFFTVSNAVFWLSVTCSMHCEDIRH